MEMTAGTKACKTPPKFVAMKLVCYVRIFKNTELPQEKKY